MKSSPLDPAYVEHLNVQSLASLPYLFIYFLNVVIPKRYPMNIARKKNALKFLKVCKSICKYTAQKTSKYLCMWHLSYLGHDTQISEYANMVSTYVKICDLLQIMDVISIQHFPFTPGLHISLHTKKTLLLHFSMHLR
jgi:hypothetical protein